MNKKILDWYVTAGVTEAVGEAPINRFDDPQARVLLKTPLPDPVESPKPALPANLLGDAVARAKNAATLDDLKNALASFNGCSLKNTAKNTVFGEGADHPDVMFIGEAPGADEDRAGRPFVGLSGQLLDKMIAAVGLSRDKNAYISNILPWRPPGNRSPSDTEISLCLPFIKKHIELVRPKILVLVGGIAMNAVLEKHASITQTRGQWLDYQTDDGASIPTMAIFHPAFLLRNPAQKKQTWRDLLTISEKLSTL